MTGPTTLHVLRQVPDVGPADLERPERPDRPERPGPRVTALAGTGPDGGRLVHPATATSSRASQGPRSRVEVENELVGFVCDLLDAPSSAVGTLTSGVTEAALVVVRAARDSRPELRRPTMVLAASAHPAFLAAAHTLGVVAVVLPVDAAGRAAVGPMGAAVGEDTVLVVASATSFTHGVVDPVAWLAAVATARDVPLHVDASAGGWSLAHAELAGHVGPPWGFAVPGVASVSIDVLPDAGLPAEVGVLLHRSPEERRHVAAGPTDPAALSTWRPAGAVLADLGETLREIGHEGCARLVRDARAATARVVAGLVDLRGVHLVSHPDAAVVTLRTDATCDVFTLADELRGRGWASQPVLSDHAHRRGPMLRVPVTAALLPVVDDLLAALADAVAAAQARGPLGLDPTIGRLLDAVGADVSVSSATLMVEAAAGLDATASTHRLLDAAGPGVREALATARRELEARPVRRGPPQPVSTSASTDASE